MKTGETWSMAADANNRVAAWDPGSYDGAGNLIAVPGLTGTSTFNAENQWTTFPGSHASFLYDGDGQRVRSSEVGLNPETTYYWNDESGHVLMESDSNLHINNLYFYLGGERIAYGPELGDYGLYFYYNDELGNVRAITNQSQNVCFTSDYYPFGGNIPGTLTNTCPAQYRQFTGKDRDPVMGVDYFGARYYKSDMSRFFSPDWSADVEPVPYSNLHDPQSLTLYSYGKNSPVRFADPDGHCPGNNCQDVNVTVSIDSQPHVMENQKAGSSYYSGVGTTTTIRFTDKGAPLAGTAVKESPRTKDNLTGQSLSNIANPKTVTTDAQGTIKDVVMHSLLGPDGGPIKFSQKDTQSMTDAANSSAYSHTTTQTLTFDAEGATCQATYSETLSNVASNGNVSTGTNAQGINFSFTTGTVKVAPVTQGPGSQ